MPKIKDLQRYTKNGKTTHYSKRARRPYVPRKPKPPKPVRGGK